jgi:hypothetical protein
MLKLEQANEQQSVTKSYSTPAYRMQETLFLCPFCVSKAHMSYLARQRPFTVMLPCRLNPKIWTP